MAKRRKGQCLDYAIGGLKRLAYDEKVSAQVRLESLKLMLKLDGVYPDPEETQACPETGSGTSSIPCPPVATDTLLQTLREKHTGGAA